MPADAKAIFLAAADQPAADRAAFLDGACAGDAVLRQRVEALLRAHDEPSVSPMTGPYAPAAPAVDELAPLFPQLEVIELIGAGGMGTVYKARQPGLDRLVALKVLPRSAADGPAFAERFTREARTLARLSHPGIVPVYDFGTAGGLYWFVMEYVDGVNLRQAQKAGTLTPAAALAAMAQVCDALQYAHDEGVVHRDIKPENVLLDRKGRVKVADFGLAKLLGRGPHESHLTGTYQAMGTPHYMAPEQWEKPLAVDHRADIYSLGVVLYELLTGELPLGRFPPPSQKARVDARLDDVVLRTLEKEPERRYQRVGDVKTDIERIGDSETVLAPPPSSAVARPRPSFFIYVVLPLLVLVGLILVAAILAYVAQPGATYSGGSLMELVAATTAFVGLPSAALLVARWLARRRGTTLRQAAWTKASWLTPRIWHSGLVRRLRAEPFAGYAALLLCVVAIWAHILPWCTAYDPQSSSWVGGVFGITLRNSGVPSAIALVAAVVVAVVATLVRLPALQERTLRGLASAFVAAALAFQAALFFRAASGITKNSLLELGRPDRLPKVVYLDVTWGLYVVVTLTVLALAFSILRLLDRSRTDRAAAATRETT